VNIVDALVRQHSPNISGSIHASFRGSGDCRIVGNASNDNSENSRSALRLRFDLKTKLALPKWVAEGFILGWP
jgi:hypothetical protein